MVIPPDLARRYVVVKNKLTQYKNANEDLLMASAKKRTGILNLRKEVLYTVEALEKARQAIQNKPFLIENERKIREGGREKMKSRHSKEKRKKRVSKKR